jgi:Zn finger protein HypA/HybF involved in hydrogenase expression
MAIKLTQDEFIQKAIDKHNDLYFYDKVVYINSRIKVKIICKEHDIFEQIPSNHLNGNGCPKCKLGGKLSTLYFIEKSNFIHNNKYDYSLVEYIKSKLKVKIICKEHGIFEQRPSNHIDGQGCPKCNFNFRSNTIEFIKKSELIHGNKYDYSLVNYINDRSKIDIICKEHGIFEQVVNYHLTGSGCPKCKLGGKSSTKKFIESVSSIHDYKYDYRLVEYINSYTKVNIMCEHHGLFKQRPANHLKGEGCPKCRLSKGEVEIMRYLDNKSITYESQFIFNNCRDKRILPFDFYIPKYNLCIEFDGEQHYKPINYFGGQKSFENQIRRDYIKDTYCLDNKISLIRISYLDYDSISNILDLIFYI